MRLPWVLASWFTLHWGFMLELGPGSPVSLGRRLPGPGSAIRSPSLQLLCIENEEFSRVADPTARTLELQQQRGGGIC